MFTCKSCGAFTSYSYEHSCPGFLTVREPSEDPGYSDTPRRVLWNVRELRKEVAALRAELQNRGPVRAFAAHWAEHD